MVHSSYMTEVKLETWEMTDFGSMLVEGSAQTQTVK